MGFLFLFIQQVRINFVGAVKIIFSLPYCYTIFFHNNRGVHGNRLSNNRVPKCLMNHPYHMYQTLVFREWGQGLVDLKRSLLIFFLFQEFAGLGGDVRFLKHNLEYQHSVELLQDVVSMSFVLC